MSDNRASMVVLIPPAHEWAPAGAVISVEDNGAGVEDRVGWHFVDPRADQCPVADHCHRRADPAGDIAVTDAQPSVGWTGDHRGHHARRRLSVRLGDETALKIGAPGITLDLGGHTLLAAQEAIRNEGHDDVTIRNGTLITTEGAVHLAHVTGNVIRNVGRAACGRDHALRADGNRISARRRRWARSADGRKGLGNDS